MKKRIFALFTMICLVASLAACGNSDSQKETTSSQTSGSATSSQTSDDELLSLEETFDADADTVQGMLDSMQALYADQGITVSLYAEGDEMHYDFTIDSDVALDEESRSTMVELLKSGTESTSEQYYDIATTVKEGVSNDVVIVVLTFFDSEGNELYTQSFSSADA